MATKTRRKANTALVFNPARRLSIGGARVNPTKKRRRSRRRRNPIVKTAAFRRRSNPVRRRSNPSTTGGLVAAAVMAGIGVSLFDVVSTRIMPQSSSLVRAGVKFGGAFLFQSRIGSKIPFLGKYKNDIALVLAVAGVVDVMKLYVLPLVTQTAASIGLVSGPLLQVGAGDDTTGNIYGNAYPASYSNFS